MILAILNVTTFYIFLGESSCFDKGQTNCPTNGKNCESKKSLQNIRSVAWVIQFHTSKRNSHRAFALAFVRLIGTLSSCTFKNDIFRFCRKWQHFWFLHLRIYTFKVICVMKIKWDLISTVEQSHILISFFIHKE